MHKYLTPFASISIDLSGIRSRCVLVDKEAVSSSRSSRSETPSRQGSRIIPSRKSRVRVTRITRLFGGRTLFPSCYGALPRDTMAIVVGSAIRFLASLHLPCIYYDFFPLAPRAFVRGLLDSSRVPFHSSTSRVPRHFAHDGQSKLRAMTSPFTHTHRDRETHTHVCTRGSEAPFHVPSLFLGFLLFSSHPTCALIDPKWSLVQARSLSLFLSLARSRVRGHPRARN